MINFKVSNLGIGNLGIVHETILFFLSFPETIGTNGLFWSPEIKIYDKKSKSFRVDYIYCNFYFFQFILTGISKRDPQLLDAGFLRLARNFPAN